MSDPRPEDALAHLQAAASEVIAAARVVLELADEFVSRSFGLLSQPAGTTPPAEESVGVEKIEVQGREDDARPGPGV